MNDDQNRDSLLKGISALQQRIDERRQVLANFLAAVHNQTISPTTPVPSGLEAAADYAVILNELDHLIVQNEHYQAQLEQQSQAIGQTTANFAARTDELERKAAELNALNQALDDKVQQLKTLLEEQDINTLKSSIKTANADLVGARNDLSDLKGTRGIQRWTYGALGVAILGLVLAGGLFAYQQSQQAQLLDQQATLSAQNNALGTEVSSLRTQMPAQPTDDLRINALIESGTQLAETVTSQADEINALKTQEAGIEEALTTMEASIPAAATPDPRVDTVEKSVGDLQTQVAQIQTSSNAQQIPDPNLSTTVENLQARATALEGRIAALEAQLTATEPTNAATAATEATAAASAEEIAATEAVVEATAIASAEATAEVPIGPVIIKYTGSTVNIRNTPNTSADKITGDAGIYSVLGYFEESPGGWVWYCFKINEQFGWARDDTGIQLSLNGSEFFAATTLKDQVIALLPTTPPTDCKVEP